MSTSPAEPGTRAPDVAREPVVRDAQLRAAILAGDPRGLRDFVDSQLRLLYAFCLPRLGRDHHAAEEVVQETLTLALDRMGEFEPERGALATWLAYLARNSIRRANEQRRRFPAGEAADLLAAIAGEDRGHEALEEAASLVEVVLARLPDNYRIVLQQKYLDGQSVRSISQAAGTSEKAVESLLVRAREAFRVAAAALPRTESSS